MTRLTIREMRANLGALDKILADEGEIVIVRHGKPVARILPVDVPKRASHAKLRARLVASGKRMKPAADDLRADRDAR